MATEIVLPKLGNSVESSIIASWLKHPGDSVVEGEAICTVETDKTTMEVASSVAGVLLKQLVQIGDDVPVLRAIALIGSAGETVAATVQAESKPAVSPRARKTAEMLGVDTATLLGSGPGGRVIERDVKTAADTQAPRLTPVAKAMVASGEYAVPKIGSGPGGIVTKVDLVTAVPVLHDTADQTQRMPLSAVRKVIAERMRASLQNTAQLTMHASADARTLLAYRAKLKASGETLGLRDVTINDLVLFALVKTLQQHPDLNATLQDNILTRHACVHLGNAVDTPRGLLVPVLRNAETLSLRDLAQQARMIAAQCREGAIAPALLSGGTFTATNLGSFGIESFTPILNVPQVAILGITTIQLKPVENAGAVEFVQHLGLSLTVDHQAVDGAPAARFLQALTKNIGQIDVLLAL